MNTVIKTKNILVTVNFKSSIFKNNIISKNIIFLGVESNKQLFYKICDYAYYGGYNGFQIESCKVLKDNTIVDANIIIFVQSGEILSLTKYLKEI